MFSTRAEFTRAFVRYLCNWVSLFVMRSVNKTSPERFEVFAAATMIYVCNKYLNGKQLAVYIGKHISVVALMISHNDE